MRRKIVIIFLDFDKKLNVQKKALNVF